MLARLEVIGSLTDRGTDGIAAWCSTYSMPAHRPLAHGQIREIAFEELHAGHVIEIAALAGDQAVDDADMVAAPDELFGEVGSDEARAAGDEIRSHSVAVSCAGRKRRPSAIPGAMRIAFW